MTATGAPGSIRVLIVDDEPDMRLLLRSLLLLDQRFEVAGEAADGGQALVRFEELRPDLLILDQRMPVLYGIEVARHILAAHPEQAILLLTAYVDDALTTEAQELGVRRVLGKEEIMDLGPELLRSVG
jgi:two-component system, NarL family, nitrate/nitrite response regulator NarL